MLRFAIQRSSLKRWGAPHDAAAVGAQCHGGAVRVAVGHVCRCAAHPILVDMPALHRGRRTPTRRTGCGACQRCRPRSRPRYAGRTVPTPQNVCRRNRCARRKIIRIKGAAGVKILHIHNENSFDCIVASWGSCQRPRPLTDEGRRSGHYCPVKGLLRECSIPPLRACTFPPQGKAFS